MYAATARCYVTTLLRAPRCDLASLARVLLYGPEGDATPPEPPLEPGEEEPFMLSTPRRRLLALAALGGSLSGCIGVGVIAVRHGSVPYKVDAPAAYDGTAREPYPAPITSARDVLRLAGEPHRRIRTGRIERWQYLLDIGYSGFTLDVVVGPPLPILPLTLPKQYFVTLIFRDGELVGAEGIRRAQVRHYCYLINLLDLRAGKLYGCGTNRDGAFSGLIGRLRLEAPMLGS